MGVSLLRVLWPFWQIIWMRGSRIPRLIHAIFSLTDCRFLAAPAVREWTHTHTHIRYE